MKRFALIGLLALVLPGISWGAIGPADVSNQTATGKTIVLKTGSLASSAVTADQVVVTYTVTVGKTLYLNYFDINARLTTYAATATYFGNCSLESPAGTKLWTVIVMNAGAQISMAHDIAEGFPFASGSVVRIVCTPSAITAFTFVGNIGGIEK